MTSPLVPTGEETWSGGRILYMPSGEDRYIHFTPAARADEIVRAGKLLQRPPYEKFGIDTVAAVSLVWGWLVPRVQLTHIQRHTPVKDIVGIVFTSSTKPKYGVPEEVIWERDVVLSSMSIVPMQRGIAMLRRTPFRIGEDDQVTYDAPDLASRVARRFNQSR